MNKFIFFFTTQLRLSNPWNYKIPFLICIPYLVLLLKPVSVKFPIVYILASISIIIGVAGFGYLSNDLGDKEQDAIINKANSTSELAVWHLVVLYLLFISFSLLPWLILPFNRISLVLLFIQFFLFYAYSFLPFRWKEKGWLGVICDSLYAHLLPAILASYTFFLLVKLQSNQYVYFVISLSIWQFILGLRNIIFHQLKDYENDLQSKTKTFVNQLGFAKSEKICKILLPLELIFFLIFSIYVSTFHPLFIVFIFSFWTILIVKTKQQVLQLGYRQKAYLMLDDLYIKWIPLVVLILLCVNSLAFTWILILHFILFRSDIKTYLLSHR